MKGALEPKVGPEFDLTLNTDSLLQTILQLDFCQGKGKHNEVTLIFIKFILKGQIYNLAVLNIK